MKKRLSYFLLLFILSLSSSELYSQSFEGQIILQNGGELWEGMIPLRSLSILKVQKHFLNSRQVFLMCHPIQMKHLIRR